MIELLILGRLKGMSRELDPDYLESETEGYFWFVAAALTVLTWPMSTAWLFRAFRVPAWVSIILAIVISAILVLLLGWWYLAVGFIVMTIGLLVAAVIHAP